MLGMKNIKVERYNSVTVEEITNFDVQLVTGWVQTTKGKNIMQRNVVLREKSCQSEKILINDKNQRQ